MKKVFKITLLVTALALAMTVSAAAEYTNFAAVPNDKVINPISGQYTVTATNSGASEAQCVVLVLKGLWQQTDFATAGTVPLTADSILYIDQKPVTASGTATFNVYPKSLPDSTVILTGLSEAPQVVGYTEGKGVTVSGKVEFLGAKTTATVTLTPVGGGDAISITTPKGAYALSSVLAGTYTLKNEKIGHVTAAATITVGEVDFDNGLITLLGGDVNGNGLINVEDLGKMLDDYGKVSSAIANLGADINESNEVNVEDLSVLLNNYGK